VAAVQEINMLRLVDHTQTIREGRGMIRWQSVEPGAKQVLMDAKSYETEMEGGTLYRA